MGAAIARKRELSILRKVSSFKRRVLMGQHHVPGNQQTGQLLADGRVMWKRFTQAATVGVVSVFALLGVMALFLLEHHK